MRKGLSMEKVYKSVTDMLKGLDVESNLQNRLKKRLKREI